MDCAMGSPRPPASAADWPVTGRARRARRCTLPAPSDGAIDGQHSWNGENGMVRMDGDAASKPRMQYRGLRDRLEQLDKKRETRMGDGAHRHVEIVTVTHMLTVNIRT